MVNIVTAADFHFSDNSPSSRKDDYAESLFEKLNQILNLCNKLKASFLLIPGDLFHVKTASKNSHRLTQRLIRIFKKFYANDCRIISIPGNHDLSFSSIESLEKQPLGVLAEAGVIELISRKETPWSKTEVYGDAEGLRFRFVGAAFGEISESSLDTVRFEKGTTEDFLICLAHVFAGPLRVNFFGNMTLGYQDMLEFGPDIFVFGHMHKDQGIQQIGNKYFVNVGAIARGSIAEDDVKRKPKVGVLQLSSDKIRATAVALKVKPATEVFDLRAKEQEDQRSKEISTFIEMLSKESEVEGEDISGRLEASDFENEIKERALIYLERAENA